MIYVYPPATIDPNITPTKVGQLWVNTVTGHVWISNGTASSANWSDVSASGGSVTFSATDKLLGRASAGAGAAEEITCTAAGRALLDDADATAQIATLFGGATGTGNAVRADSPTLVTPTLGVASATSLTTSALSTLGSFATGAAHLIGGAYGSNGSGTVDYSLGWTSGIVGVNSSGRYGFTSSATDARGAQDVSLYRIAAGHLGLHNGSSAQSFSVYNVAGTDYERGVFDWQATADTLTIGTQKGGAGSTRAIKFVVGGTSALDISTSANATFAGSITHGSATLLTTTTALTNGAAAATGTLTNAPAAGNPTKWIPINDNGTTRYIPAW